MNRLRLNAHGRARDHPHCLALHPGGAECFRPVLAPEHQRCPSHQREYKKLYKSYKDAQTYYESFGLPDNEFDLDSIEEKITRGKKVMELRTEVHQRFFSDSSNNRGHLQWILKLNEDIRALENKIALRPARESNQTDGPRGQFFYQSLLSPDIPESALSHLPVDSPVWTLREVLANITEANVSRLYRIVPSLNDSLPKIEDPEENTPREPHPGDHVMRYILREFVLWRADEEALWKAKEAESIHLFLRKVPWMLEDLIKFFELLGRPDTLHFLRDAVRDYLALCDTPDASSTVMILGGPIITDDKQRTMAVQGWDILRQYFSNVVNWTNLESFCVGFEDLVFIQQLIALGRYPNRADDCEWFSKDHGPQESPHTVFHGFLAVAKGFPDPPIPLVTVQDGVIIQRQSRCYLVGRMAKNNPLVTSLIQELVNRVVRFIVIVLDMEINGDVSTKIISRNGVHEEIPWVTRKKSANVGENLEDIPWTIEWSFQNIISDMTVFRELKERNLRKDYFEFIIIDQAPALDFQILNEVVDILSLVAGDPPPEDLLEKVVRSSLPKDQQNQWLKAITLECPSFQGLNLGNLYYEGNRSRAWDILDKDHSFLRGFRERNLSFRDRRFMSKILSEMEKNGIVSVLKTLELSYGCPIVLQGTDGCEDLYIAYSLKSAKGGVLYQNREWLQRLSGSLYAFAREIKAKHPNAVFAKGKFHVHYCAWPMAPPEEVPVFRTSDGHLYRWNALPFDYPSSTRLWQTHIDKVLNERLPFAFFCQTTFVISASHPDFATASLGTVITAADEYGWKLSVPEPQEWVCDIDNLDLSNLWKGVPPALFKPKS